MIINALLFSLIFLTLFGLALWPVLFKNSRHPTLAFISANVVFVILLLGYGAHISRQREAHQTRMTEFRTAAAACALLLESPVKFPAPPPLKKHDPDSNIVPAVLLEEIDQWMTGVRAVSAQTPSSDNPDAGKETSAK